MPGKSDKVVIWPIYFDSSKTRSEGRAVASSDAIKEPSIEKLINAARRAGLNPEVEREKKHPSAWFDAPGRLLVNKTAPKSVILKKISKALKR